MNTKYSLNNRVICWSRVKQFYDNNICTAGVYLLIRSSFILEYAPTALLVITWIGALSAFMAASAGLLQNDLKRVIAYSTMSQLGYMFMAVG